MIQLKYLQKLGKALMLPVSCMPICGLLMGLGYCLCPAAMQGGEIAGLAAQIGYFLVRAGGALIDHIAWLFAIGVGIGMAEDNDGTGARAALVSWLMITTLLNVNTVSALLPALTEDSSRALAFEKIDNPFIGILSGIIGSLCYNRFRGIRLPDWLSFFSGKRAVAIVAGVFSIAASAVLLLVWPLIFSGLTTLGRGIAGMGALGAGIYAFLNRLLIPFGLHHALNNVFWFDTIGLGDLTHFWAGETSADVGWSLGMYMSGFFPCMMFGVPGAALAVVRSAKPEKRKAVSVLLSFAVCAFVCGVTEPFEFSFMFLSPALYAAYSVLYGAVAFLTVLTGFRAGFCFSAGATDLVFSASLPAAAKTWLILPLGAGAFALFYGVFRFMITRWNLKTPGREDGEVGPGAIASAASSAENKYAAMAQAVLAGLGGAENVVSVDNCITRLRLEIKDQAKVDEGAIRAAGALGLIRPGANSLQIVIGTTVQFVADELKALVGKGSVPAQPLAAGAESEAGREPGPSPAEALLPPVKGERVAMADIPDPVFSGGVMGECFGILPAEGKIYAPLTGAVTAVAAARHAISIEGSQGEEILIHVGLDTVKLGGEGFQPLVGEGDAVTQGQLILEADLDTIRARGFNPMVIVCRINGEE